MLDVYAFAGCLEALRANPGDEAALAAMADIIIDSGEEQVRKARVFYLPGWHPYPNDAPSPSARSSRRTTMRRKIGPLLVQQRKVIAYRPRGVHMIMRGPLRPPPSSDFWQSALDALVDTGNLVANETSWVKLFANFWEDHPVRSTTFILTALSLPDDLELPPDPRVYCTGCDLFTHYKPFCRHCKQSPCSKCGKPTGSRRSRWCPDCWPEERARQLEEINAQEEAGRSERLQVKAIRQARANATFVGNAQD